MKESAGYAPVSGDEKLNPEILRDYEQFCECLPGEVFQQIFNHLPGVFFVVKNLEGRVMLANQVAAQMCGFEFESELIGKTDVEIFSEQQASGYLEDDRHVFETGEPMVDKVEIAPDPNNSINWLVVTKIPLYNRMGDMIGLACIGRNTSGTHEMLQPYLEMNTVFEHVRQHYALPLKIEELAAIVHLSTSQFERRFRQLFGITPAKYIQKVRVNAACNRLVSTRDTVATIAVETGFYDQSHFSRAFRRVMGLSPSEYRRHGSQIML